jgi:hypothetical protein
MQGLRLCHRINLPEHELHIGVHVDHDAGRAKSKVVLEPSLMSKMVDSLYALPVLNIIEGYSIEW